MFYRKLYINGLEHIDPSKTYLITSNHPNGFFEPLIMACTFPIDLHFMVRGDMFANPFMNWFLRSTNQIPIFRFVDGYAKMKENQSSLMEATSTLNRGGSIMLFAEGSTEALMRCRPIQKGTAKMAFQTFDEYPDKELEILPVGINFNNWRNPGSEVIVNVGKSFDAKPYYTSNVETKPKGILQLTREIETKMKLEIIHLDDKVDEVVIRQLWDLQTLIASSSPRKDKNNKIYYRMKAVADDINNGKNTYNEQISRLYTIANTANGGKRIMGKKSFWKSILLLPGIFGLVFHFLPVYIGYWMRDTKVRRDAFASPVLGITAFISVIIWYIVTLVSLWISFGFLFAFSILLVLALCGYCYLLYWENTNKIGSKQLPASFRSELDELLSKIG